MTNARPKTAADVLAPRIGADHPTSARPQRYEAGAGLQGSKLWEATRAALTPLYEASLPKGADQDAFYVHTVCWQAVHGSLRRTRAAGQVLRRGPDQIRGGADQIMIYLQVAGILESRCGNQSVRVEPGDVIIYDYAQPILSITEAFENLVLNLDRDTVPMALLSTEAHGFRLPGTSGIAQLIASALFTLEAQAAGLSMIEMEAGAEAVALLATAGLRAARPVLRDADNLQARAVAFIDAHIASRDLSPEAIGDHLKLSRSALYRLLEPYGGVRALVLARRLDRAATLLLTDPGSHRALLQVAQRHGFPTSALFSRLFSERFGMPPSRYCALIREGDPAWIDAQFVRAGHDGQRLQAHLDAGGLK